MLEVLCLRCKSNRDNFWWQLFVITITMLKRLPLFTTTLLSWGQSSLCGPLKYPLYFFVSFPSSPTFLYFRRMKVAGSRAIFCDGIFEMLAEPLTCQSVPEPVLIPAVKCDCFGRLGMRWFEKTIVGGWCEVPQTLIYRQTLRFHERDFRIC